MKECADVRKYVLASALEVDEGEPVKRCLVYTNPNSGDMYVFESRGSSSGVFGKVVGTVPSGHTPSKFNTDLGNTDYVGKIIAYETLKKDGSTELLFTQKIQSADELTDESSIIQMAERASDYKHRLV